MKATELMVGDFVDFYHPQEPEKKIITRHRVTEIWECELVGISNHNNPVHPDHLEPIPLTAEILEKNGFIRYGTSYILKESMFELTNPSNPDRYLDNYYIRFARQNKRVMYVHKLQHFMREFGIEKEIEL